MKRRGLLPVFLGVAALWAQSKNAAPQGTSSDYLARLLHQGTLGWGMLLAGMAAAFGLGAVHALSPGHGKTIVAAYLVGSRSTARHAALLGLMVTFTHTISVFFLGFVTLFLSRYLLPEKIYPMLGTISGLSIIWIGGMLFYRRLRAAKGHHHHHGGARHDHGDGHVHSHLPEGEVGMASLMALGASGGLVPCPSALVLLLSSVALGRIALGLTLLVAFSAGLAVVLMAIGMAALYAKHLLPDSQKTARSVAFRYIPVASAAVIACVGAVMTAVALGVIRVAI
jgi:nickel/cobalt exporter